MIGLGDMAAVAARLEQENFEEWCEARGVDPGALVQVGEQQGQAMFRAICNGEVASPLDAFSAMTLLGLQLGMELERRRADREELPR